MKAVLCKEWGQPESLVIEEVPNRQPKAGEVLVEVHAAGVNFPDTLIIQKKYQFQPALPFVPGGEVAGIVKAIGPAVTCCDVGDRVIGSFGWGGFATEAIVEDSRIVPMPDDMDFVTASAYVLAYGTSLHALQDRARLAAGETLLVLGASGGTGIAAIEIGKAMGARVIAAASSAERLEFCRSHGADAGIDYRHDDLRERIKTLTDGRGVDVVYDPVGGPYTEPAFRSLAWNGRHLVVGFAAGEIPRLPLNLPLLKGAAVVGVFWGNFLRQSREAAHSHMAALMALHRSGKVRPPITRTFPLEEAGAALRLMMDRRSMGKIVIVPQAG